MKKKVFSLLILSIIMISFVFSGFAGTSLAVANEMDANTQKIADVIDSQYYAKTNNGLTLSKSRYDALKEHVSNFININNCNHKDFSIPEFSFTSNSIYSSKGVKKYYNGAFECYEEDITSGYV